MLESTSFMKMSFCPYVINPKESSPHFGTTATAIILKRDILFRFFFARKRYKQIYVFKLHFLKAVRGNTDPYTNP